MLPLECINVDTTLQEEESMGKKIEEDDNFINDTDIKEASSSNDDVNEDGMSTDDECD